MANMGRALMGTGRATGERRAIEAAQQAISSPLLEDVSITGATGILINITGGPDLTLHEVNDASSLISEAAHEDANIIFGSVIDPACGDEVRITVIATGFDRVEAQVVIPSWEQRQQMTPRQAVRHTQVQVPLTYTPSRPDYSPARERMATPTTTSEAAPRHVAAPPPLPLPGPAAFDHLQHGPVTQPIRPATGPNRHPTPPSLPARPIIDLSDETSELDVPTFQRRNAPPHGR